MVPSPLTLTTFGSWLGIFLAGGLGAVSRFALTLLASGWSLAANVVGCLLMGLVLGARWPWLVENPWRLWLTVGFLGGFTTFSAFAAELWTLSREASPTRALLYAALSVGLGLVALLLGVAISRWLGSNPTN